MITLTGGNYGGENIEIDESVKAGDVLVVDGHQYRVSDDLKSGVFIGAVEE